MSEKARQKITEHRIAMVDILFFEVFKFFNAMSHRWIVIRI